MKIGLAFLTFVIVRYNQTNKQTIKYLNRQSIIKDKAYILEEGLFIKVNIIKTENELIVF